MSTPCKHTYPFLALLLLFSLSASACQTAHLPSPTSTSLSTPTTRPTPTIQLREVRREEAGGYAYQPIPGYQVASDGGVVTMLEYGADPQVGPSLTLYGGAPDPGATAQALLDQLKGDETIRLSEPQTVTIGGYAGLAADIVILRNNVELHGRIAVVVTPDVQFIALAACRQARWQAELMPLFEAVLASINFFPRVVTPEPGVPAIQTPSPPSP